MSLADLDLVNIDAVLEPSIFTCVSELMHDWKSCISLDPRRSVGETQELTCFTNLDIIPTHLPLPHLSILSKRPIFEAVAALPLHPVVCILELVPKLNGDSIVCKCEELLPQAIRFFFFPLLGE